MEHDDLTNRIRRLGTAPIDPDTRDAHLARMTAATPAPTAGRRERPFSRIAVAAAAIVGFLAGSTGFAMAGALPDPAQGVAHDVLGLVQIDVPTGNSENAPGHDPDGPGNSENAPGHDPDGPGNSENAPGHDPDGPGNSENAPGAASSHAPGVAPTDADPCKGKPAWVGDRELGDDEKAALQAERDACPDDDDDNDEAPED